MSAGEGLPASVRIDSWLWAVRLTKTRSQAGAACRAGHVRVNGVRAKPATPVRVGDTVEARLGGRLRIAVARRLIVKRVGASVAAGCLTDRSPAPLPARQDGPFGLRERGAGRPTKRDRRAIEHLRGR